MTFRQPANEWDGIPSLRLGYQVSSGNGVYCGWSANANGLGILIDRFGFRSLFYRVAESQLRLSTKLEPLLDDQSVLELDDDAIAVFLRRGFFLGDDTPFRNIKVVPPGAEVNFKNGSWVFARNPVPCGPTSELSVEQAIGEYGRIFEQAIGRFGDLIANKKVAVPLSGGRDSRHIALALHAMNLGPFGCVTLKHRPPRSDDDLTVAREICRRIGVPHSVVEQSTNFLASELVKNNLTQFSSLEHAWMLPLADHFRQHNYQVFFDGIGGDVLSAGLFLTTQRLDLYRRERWPELAEDILGSEGILPQLFSRTAYKRFSREKAAARVISELKKHANTPNPVGQFFFWNRTRRHIASSTWNILSNCHGFAPYLDADVYAFLSSLPAEFFLDHSFHDRAISARYPELKDIAYESKLTAPKPENRRANLRFLWHLTCYLRTSFSTDSFLDPKYLYSRLARSFLHPTFRFAHSPRLAIYMAQLMQFVQEKRGLCVRD